MFNYKEVQRLRNELLWQQTEVKRLMQWTSTQDERQKDFLSAVWHFNFVIKNARDFVEADYYLKSDLSTLTNRLKKEKQEYDKLQEVRRLVDTVMAEQAAERKKK